jgi:hypothetical protein
MRSLSEPFYKILQVALGASQDFLFTLSEKEWEKLFVMAKRQSVLGIVYDGIVKLPKEKRPSINQTLRWSCVAESIRGMNEKMNREAARITRLFEEHGRHSVILKGQANARLYPNPLARQAGDIDIWIPGGFKGVVDFLKEHGLILSDENLKGIFHHVEMHGEDGISIEVHYKPASGIPFRDGEFQKYLLDEVGSATLVPEGFYAPSIKFALVMQLAHLQQHFFSKGLGLRQYMDYYMLLLHSTEEDRREVAAVMKRLSMMRACAGVMWVLGHVFALEQGKMLCPPDAWRGRRLLCQVLEGGNFGQYGKEYRLRGIPRWFNDRLRVLRWLSFDPVNVLFKELRYWRSTLFLIPLRIKKRELFLSRTREDA